MKTPWHLWVIGVLTLLWHGFGAFDYTMTQTANEGYLAAFTAEQRAYFDSYPAWAVAGWALGVWGSTLGSLLLLLRSRFALHAFVAALAGSLLALVWSQFVSEVSATDLMGPGSWIITALIYGIVVLMIWYALRMTRAGVLR
jgi:hypothetical protein